MEHPARASVQGDGSCLCRQSSNTEKIKVRAVHKRPSRMVRTTVQREIHLSAEYIHKDKLIADSRSHNHIPLLVDPIPGSLGVAIVGDDLGVALRRRADDTVVQINTLVLEHDAH